jgi:hypothetical protein
MDKDPNSMIISLEEDEIINNILDWPDCRRERPWDYRGWKIWSWTGWKGNWCRKNPFYAGVDKVICPSCNKAIEVWDIVYISQALRGFYHAECQPNYKGTIAGQWLATWYAPPNGVGGESDRHACSPAPENKTGVYEEYTYAYASAPGQQGIYKKGECFDIKSDDPPTYFTDPEELIILRDDALARLKAFIDSEVEHANL